EYDIRGCAYPRYHLEMALLRWIHLRQLVPISDLIQGLEKGAPPTGRSQGGGSAPVGSRSAAPAAVPPRPQAPAPPPRVAAPAPAPEPPRRPAPPPPRPPAVTAATVKAVEARTQSANAPAAASEPMPDVQPVAPEMLKDAFLAEV